MTGSLLRLEACQRSSIWKTCHMHWTSRQGFEIILERAGVKEKKISVPIRKKHYLVETLNMLCF